MTPVRETSSVVPYANAPVFDCEVRFGSAEEMIPMAKVMQAFKTYLPPYNLPNSKVSLYAERSSSSNMSIRESYPRVLKSEHDQTEKLRKQLQESKDHDYKYNSFFYNKCIASYTIKWPFHLYGYSYKDEPCQEALAYLEGLPIHNKYADVQRLSVCKSVRYLPRISCEYYEVKTVSEAIAILKPLIRNE